MPCARICTPTAFRWSRSAPRRASSPRAPISTAPGSNGRRTRSGRPPARRPRCCRISAARCRTTCSRKRWDCRRSGCRIPIPAARSMRRTSTSCSIGHRRGARHHGGPVLGSRRDRGKVAGSEGDSAMALAHADAPDRAPSRGKNVTRLVVATSLGNALEWFDISVYAYFAVYLSKAFFPNERSDHLAAADLRHLRPDVPGAADRRRAARHLCRPLRPQGVADAVDRDDDLRHAGGGAACRPSRQIGVLAPLLGHRRPPGAGLFRRRRVRQLDRVPGRAHAGPARLCRELAIREPGHELAARRGVSACCCPRP